MPDTLSAPYDGLTRTVAILGGGLSGAAVAWHLARDPSVAGVRIVVVEPQADLGRGLAYATQDPAHRLNVPHGKMSLDPDQPDHFLRWLTGPEGPELPPGSRLPDGRIFAPRAVFGDYVADYLAPLLADGTIRHLRTQAVSVQRVGGRRLVRLADGGTLSADVIVLAVAHPAPTIPAEYAALADDPRLIRDAFAPKALERIDTEAHVLVVGSGLTAADIVATLDRRGHRGQVTLTSRHGWLSQGHGPTQAETTADYAKDSARTAGALLRRVRRDLAKDAALGLTWHAVFDRLRAQGPAIWAALPVAERRRFLRHLRGLWDVHRFRIAPQSADSLARLSARGQLAQVAGRATAVVAGPRSIHVTLRRRGGAGRVTLNVNHIVLATGPAHARITETNPLLRQMAGQGLIAPDVLRLGLATAPTGQALGADGEADPTLLIAGPLARGTVGELMGVPEVTAWAKSIAARAAQALTVTTEGAAP